MPASAKFSSFDLVGENPGYLREQHIVPHGIEVGAQSEAPYRPVGTRAWSSEKQLRAYGTGTRSSSSWCQLRTTVSFARVLSRHERVGPHLSAERR